VLRPCRRDAACPRRPTVSNKRASAAELFFGAIAELHARNFCAQPRWLRDLGGTTCAAKLIDNVISMAPNAVSVVTELRGSHLRAGRNHCLQRHDSGASAGACRRREHILMVDHSVLTASGLGDGVHRNGSVKMGDISYAAIRSYLTTGM
jgi:hypothetical protein